MLKQLISLHISVPLGINISLFSENEIHFSCVRVCEVCAGLGAQTACLFTSAVSLIYASAFIHVIEETGNQSVLEF